MYFYVQANGFSNSLRKDFEDCHLLDQQHGICGVFDGHSGDEAALFCVEKMRNLALEATDAPTMTKAFGDCDDALRQALATDSEAGTTATLVKVLESDSHGIKLLVANLGDSRAFLWRKATDSLEITQDHRPSNASERRRIEEAGGWVEEDRVDGTLGCSRALGDFHFKEVKELPKVSGVPEVYHWTAQPGDWLILGCDGIWDTISNQQVVNRICKGAGDLGERLESLLHFCIEKEADDNLTLLAIELGAVEFQPSSISLSEGNFLKTKDSEVLEQYDAFCQRFGYKLQKEMHAKGPPTVSWSKTKTTLPRFVVSNVSSTPTPLVIVGPSGVGKGTLIAKIRENFAGRFGFSVSHTTRKPRPGEVHGEAYNFVDIETMKKEVEIPGRFLEHATVHGNLYGTSQEAVEKVRQKGQICILDVDVQGAQQIKKLHSDFKYLFIAPPSLDSLEKRLRSRGTETEDKVQTRLRNAKSEIDFYTQNLGFFDDVLVNDDLGLATHRAWELMRTWYPELVQQLKVTARQSVPSLVHQARHVASGASGGRPSELILLGVGHALPLVASVASVLQQDGHQVAAVRTGVEGTKNKTIPEMKVIIQFHKNNGVSH